MKKKKLNKFIYKIIEIQNSICWYKKYLKNNIFIALINSAAELLREAERMIDRKIHPQTIISGYRKAASVALEALEAAANDNRLILNKFFLFIF